MCGLQVPCCSTPDDSRQITSPLGASVSYLEGRDEGIIVFTKVIIKRTLLLINAKGRTR
jgi:hypothetical protein